HFLLNDRARRSLVTQALPSASAAAAPEPGEDRQRFLQLLDLAAGDLERELAGAGRPLYFEVFRTYVLEAGSESYRDVAVRLGLSESDVRNYLTYCRTAFRERLRRRIRETVDTDAEVDQEISALLRL
ncbi:MAG: hypothetical protein JO332_13685, partial [Planctomycetaceae bacterium]|nr:hypothetical protein [Planctomycetaceae bacterium]